MRDFFEVFWACFTVGGILLFAVVEWVAIKSPAKGDTYTENIQRWMGIKRKPRGPETLEQAARRRKRERIGRYTWLVVWGLFSAWFVAHIAGAGV